MYKIETTSLQRCKNVSIEMTLKCNLVHSAVHVNHISKTTGVIMKLHIKWAE